MYELQGFEGDFQPYSGPRRAESVFVVGLGTDGERLFTRKQNREAIDYAKSSKLRLIQLHSTQISYRAAAELFGEPPPPR